ncbi:MAG TPA: hypothetical protein PKY86_03650 [Niabella sp.]|nr:hypothetical protein [Niabella sp.]HQW14214.1 hypothetical protein [Niabella sp.]HQX19614.1 hypothetical protein [Niabella sp.]HQX39952.1 hypothetical protein [Niabella sp.]HRB06945.1 hypothetical protein [Niabella sp.]
MKFIRLLGLLAIPLAIASCQKEFVSEESTMPPRTEARSVSKSKTLSPEELATIKTRLENFIATHKISDNIKLPDGRGDGNNNQSILKNNFDYLQWKKVADRAINPGDYLCSSTNFNDWVDNSIDDWDFIDYLNWYFFGDLPMYEALYFDNEEGGDYYGVNDEYYYRVEGTLSDLKKFWNKYPVRIQAVDMHGDLYDNIRYLTFVIQYLYGISPGNALDFATDLRAYFGQPQFDNYNHPLFSLNAFAFYGNEEYIPGFESILGPLANKIVMGDGILMGIKGIGFDDVGCEAIMGHEFAHQIQYKMNYFGPNSPEGTRRTELMADAFSAYYLTHNKGKGMKGNRVSHFFEVFYNIGDCSFSSSGHHGTPNQRKKAAEWGYNLAQNTRGRVLKVEQVFALFEAALPGIVAPDAS